MKLNIKQSANWFFVVVLALCALNILVFIISHSEAKKNESRVVDTNEVILLTAHLLSAMKDAETGQRGYLLTNNENYLMPYFDGIEKARIDLRALTLKAANNPEQLNRLKRLSELVETKFSELQDTVDLQLEGRSQLALDIVNTDLGKRVMDEIRLLVAEFVAQEKYALQERMRLYEQSTEQSLLLTLVSSSFILLVIAITAMFVRKQVVLPITELTQNTQSFTPGRRFNFEKTRVNNEIGQLSNAFSIMSGQITQSFEELTKAKEAADSANQAKGQFLANMSHEIRTPLNGIYGSLQLLQHDSVDGEERQKVIDNSMLSCKSLLTIINDILDFSKIEAKQLSIETVPLDFGKIVQLVTSDLKPMADAKSITIHIVQRKNYREGWMGDPVRLKQILLNLLSNAVKFTEAGGVEFNFGQLTSDNREWLSFDVIDTGVGMSEQAVSRLFDRFEQADKSTTRKFGGTGLGMAITKALVELMGGKLEVESSVGKGSRFSIQLPLEKIQLTCQSEAKKEPIQAPKLIGVNVLLAEDNKVNQTIFKAMMKATGANVVVAENGEEAVTLMPKIKPEIVFMDIQMPVMDGIAAHRLIKRDYQQTPVIALTANIMEKDLELYKLEGFVGYIGKPLEMKILYNNLEKYLLD